MAVRSRSSAPIPSDRGAHTALRRDATTPFGAIVRSVRPRIPRHFVGPSGHRPSSGTERSWAAAGGCIGHSERPPRASFYAECRSVSHRLRRWQAFRIGPRRFPDSLGHLPFASTGSPLPLPRLGGAGWLASPLAVPPCGRTADFPESWTPHPRRKGARHLDSPVPRRPRACPGDPAALSAASSRTTEAHRRRRRPHLARMPLAGKIDKSLDPVNVRLLGAVAVVPPANCVTHQVQQTWRRASLRRILLEHGPLPE